MKQRFQSIKTRQESINEQDAEVKSLKDIAESRTQLCRDLLCYLESAFNGARSNMFQADMIKKARQALSEDGK